VKDETRKETGYNLVDATTGKVLSRHRTRTAAFDNWRVHRRGIAIKIIHRDSRGDEKLVVEGTWHEPRPLGG